MSGHLGRIAPAVCHVSHRYNLPGFPQGQSVCASWALLLFCDFPSESHRKMLHIASMILLHWVFDFHGRHHMEHYCFGSLASSCDQPPLMKLCLFSVEDLNFSLKKRMFQPLPKLCLHEVVTGSVHTSWYGTEVACQHLKEVKAVSEEIVTTWGCSM